MVATTMQHSILQTIYIMCRSGADLGSLVDGSPGDAAAWMAAPGSRRRAIAWRIRAIASLPAQTWPHITSQRLATTRLGRDA